jgi:hypothetical protein
VLLLLQQHLLHMLLLLQHLLHLLQQLLLSSQLTLQHCLLLLQLLMLCSLDFALMPCQPLCLMTLLHLLQLQCKVLLGLEVQH